MHSFSHTPAARLAIKMSQRGQRISALINRPRKLVRLAGNPQAIGSHLNQIIAPTRHLSDHIAAMLKTLETKHINTRQQHENN